MNLLSFLIKDLLRRKLRILLTIAGVAVGLAACTIMLGLSQSIRDSFRLAHSNRNIDIIVFEKDGYNILSSKVDEAIIRQLQRLPEVESAAAAILDLQKFDNRYLPLFGWAPGSLLYDQIVISSGRKPAQAANEVIVGDLFARASEKKIGDKLSIKGQPFEIVGVFKSQVPFERSALVISLDMLQRIKNTGATVAAVHLRLKSGYRNKDTVDAVSRRIEELYPKISAQPADIFMSEKTRQIILGEKFSLLIAIVIIVAVVLGLSNTMITTVFEQRKLMGVLIALGWQKSDVLKLVFSQALLLVFFAGAIGAGIGFYATAGVFRMMEISVFAPAQDFIFILKVAGMILVSGLAAALIPAWIIINLNPVEVIKSE